MTADLLGQLVDEIAAAVADRVVQTLRPETVETTAPAPEWGLLTTAETSKRLGRSERWVRKQVKTGALPWVKLDAGPLAFLPGDVETFARARRVPAEDDHSLATRLPAGLNAARANGSRGDLRSNEPGVAERGARL